MKSSTKNQFILILGTIIILLSIISIYLLFLKSNITTHIGSYKRITISDLESGIKCEPLMSSSIKTGRNSDDQFILFGNMEEHKAGEKTLPVMKITNDSKTLQQEYSDNNVKEFEVVKQNNSSVHATFEGTGNPYTEYLILDLYIGQFRYTRTHFFGGNGIFITRGECHKSE